MSNTLNTFFDSSRPLGGKFDNLPSNKVESTTYLFDSEIKGFELLKGSDLDSYEAGEIVWADDLLLSNTHMDVANNMIPLMNPIATSQADIDVINSVQDIRSLIDSASKFERSIFGGLGEQITKIATSVAPENKEKFWNEASEQIIEIAPNLKTSILELKKDPINQSISGYLLDRLGSDSQAIRADLLEYNITPRSLDSINPAWFKGSKNILSNAIEEAYEFRAAPMEYAKEVVSGTMTVFGAADDLLTGYFDVSAHPKDVREARENWGEFKTTVIDGVKEYIHGYQNVGDTSTLRWEVALPFILGGGVFSLLRKVSKINHDRSHNDGQRNGFEDFQIRGPERRSSDRGGYTPWNSDPESIKNDVIRRVHAEDKAEYMFSNNKQPFIERNYLDRRTKLRGEEGRHYSPEVIQREIDNAMKKVGEGRGINNSFSSHLDLDVDIPIEKTSKNNINYASRSNPDRREITPLALQSTDAPLADISWFKHPKDSPFEFKGLDFKPEDIDSGNHSFHVYSDSKKNIETGELEEVAFSPHSLEANFDPNNKSLNIQFLIGDGSIESMLGQLVGKIGFEKIESISGSLTKPWSDEFLPRWLETDDLYLAVRESALPKATESLGFTGKPEISLTWDLRRNSSNKPESWSSNDNNPVPQIPTGGFRNLQVEFTAHRPK